jgi:hypothetical protein
VLAAHDPFRLQYGHVAAPAGVVEAAHASEVDVVDFSGECLQHGDRVGAGAVGEGGIGFAKAFGQLGHVRVNFVLQQRGAGRGTAPANVALLDHRNIVAVFCQLVGDQRAADADAAANHHAATQVALQPWECMHQAVLDRPERIAAFQIHVLLRWRGVAWRAWSVDRNVRTPGTRKRDAHSAGSTFLPVAAVGRLSSWSVSEGSRVESAGMERMRPLAALPSMFRR